MNTLPIDGDGDLSRDEFAGAIAKGLGRAFPDRSKSNLI
jgi:hypothetical protein